MTITGRANFSGYVEADVDADKETYTEMEYRWRIRENLPDGLQRKSFSVRKFLSIPDLHLTWRRQRVWHWQ